LVTSGGLWFCLWCRRWRFAGLAVIATGLGIGLAARPPDILIDAQGELAAVRTGAGSLELSSKRRSGFRTETWIRRSDLDAAAVGQAGCDRLGCVWRLDGRTISYLRDARAIADDCRLADIVLAEVPIRRCPSAELVVDRFDLWREGAHAIRLGDDGFEIETVAEWRGVRAWAPDRGTARWRRRR
jgi:competence protein ComEC